MAAGLKSGARLFSPILQTGIILCAVVTALAYLSYQFPYGVDANDAPLTLYIGLALIAGGLWATIGFQIQRPGRTVPALWMIALLGLFMRAAMFFSTPVLEDDSYRYLWDGAVIAQGVDPYKYTPAEASPSQVFGESASETRGPDLERLKALADANPEAYSRINYPYVSTIYPPLAQAAFVMAHWIDPFGLTGWRFVLLLSDIATFFLLLSVLRAYGRPIAWASLYWWNPLVILQAFGAGHMDILVLPFLLLALLVAKSSRVGLASLALAGGVAVKIWPILLFPFLVRPVLRRPAKAMLYSILFGVAVLVLLLPQVLHVLSPEAGLNAYASDWRTHAFIFAILEDAVFASLETPGQVARLSVAALIITLTGFLVLRYADDVDRLPSLCAIASAALIFLSPTGYPWYFIWLAPLLPFLPRLGLIALFALAPLYWFRFAFGDEASIYQWGIVPVAFGLPLLLLALPYLDRISHDAISHHHTRFK